MSVTIRKFEEKNWRIGRMVSLKTIFFMNWF